jgi:hypothetical protein
MNLSELRTFIKMQLRENTTELDSLIDLQINMSYRKLARMALWPSLKVDDEQFETVTSQRFYPLPYNFERIIKDSLRYNTTETSSGTLVPISTGNRTQLYRAENPGSDAPRSASIAAAADTPLYNTGTVSVTNRGTTVTGVGTTFTAAMEGEWIVFLDDSAGLVGGDYGYEIDTFNSTTSLTLVSAYRGPTLTTARYQIRPTSGQRLVFDPYWIPSLSNDVLAEGSLGFGMEGPNGGFDCTYAYQKRPMRLYNPEDMMEVDVLGDAVAWDVIANMAVYHDSKTLIGFATNEARRSLVMAKATLLS